MKMSDGRVYIIHAYRTHVEVEETELVMCRSCENCIPNMDRSYHCRVHGGYVEEDDWCSWAEKKEAVE